MNANTPITLTDSRRRSVGLLHRVRTEVIQFSPTILASEVATTLNTEYGNTEANDLVRRARGDTSDCIDPGNIIRRHLIPALATIAGRQFNVERLNTVIVSDDYLDREPVIGPVFARWLRLQSPQIAILTYPHSPTS